MSKQVVNLEQFHNPRKGEQTNGVTNNDDWTYFVVSLKNRLNPPAGTYISEAHVAALIENDVDVNISAPKGRK